MMVLKSSHHCLVVLAECPHCILVVLIQFLHCLMDPYQMQLVQANDTQQGYPTRYQPGQYSMYPPDFLQELRRRDEEHRQRMADQKREHREDMLAMTESALKERAASRQDHLDRMARRDAEEKKEMKRMRKEDEIRRKNHCEEMKRIDDENKKRRQATEERDRKQREEDRAVGMTLIKTVSSWLSGAPAPPQEDRSTGQVATPSGLLPSNAAGDASFLPPPRHI